MNDSRDTSIDYKPYKIGATATHHARLGTPSTTRNKCILVDAPTIQDRDATHTRAIVSAPEETKGDVGPNVVA